MDGRGSTAGSDGLGIGDTLVHRRFLGAQGVDDRLTHQRWVRPDGDAEEHIGSIQTFV